jgi:MFS family permease
MTPPSWLTTPRAAITIVFFAYGAAVGSWAGTVPQVTRVAGVDDVELGLGLTAYTIAYVLAMAIGPRLARWTTNRAILTVMLPLVALSCFLLMISPSATYFAIAIIIFGAILGLTDLFMNAEASAIEADLARPVFASFHGSASLGIACFAIIGSVLGALAGPWLAAAFSGFLLLGSVQWTRRCLPSRRPSLVTHIAEGSIVADMLPLTLLGLAAGLVIAGETAALMWSAKLLDEQAASLAAIAGLGVAFFGLCHASIRFMGDRYRARFGDFALMTGSLVVAAAGFAATGLSRNFSTSVLAFAFIGFGTACVIPCIFALAGRLSAANRAKGIGYISMVAGLPRALAPWLFGWLAETRSTSFAFATCAIAMAAALVLVVIIRKHVAATAQPEP